MIVDEDADKDPVMRPFAAAGARTELDSHESASDTLRISDIERITDLVRAH